MDSSAFTKLCLQELGPLDLEAELIRQSDEAKLCASIALVEFQSSIARRLRMGDISESAAHHAQAEFAAAFARFTSWSVDSVLDSASRLVDTRGLRTLDALQLASALDIHSYLPSRDRLIFVASDKRLLDAAAAEGLPSGTPKPPLSRPLLL